MNLNLRVYLMVDVIAQSHFKCIKSVYVVNCLIFACRYLLSHFFWITFVARGKRHKLSWTSSSKRYIMPPLDIYTYLWHFVLFCLYYWNAGIFMMPTLSPLVVPEVIITTTSGTTSYGKVSTMKQLRQSWHHDSRVSMTAFPVELYELFILADSYA